MYKFEEVETPEFSPEIVEEPTEEEAVENAVPAEEVGYSEEEVEDEEVDGVDTEPSEEVEAEE